MRILFLPHSFPGPFRGTASKLAAQEDNKVLFVTNRSRNDVRIPNVGRILINQPPIPSISDRAELEAVRGIRRATHMANVLIRLKSKGFFADIVIANAGLGYSLYVRDIFPEAFLVAYAEGFHEQGNTFTLFSKGKVHPSFDFAPDRVRNFFQWNALHDCHMAYTSTEWQKSLYPTDLSKKIHVFHEGIDTEFFVPKAGERFCIDGCDLSHVEELITFSGRSMEAQHVLPAFLHALPQILQERPESHIVVMSSSVNKNTAQTDKWLKTLRETYDFDERRLHFISFCPYKDYRRLLQASHVHVFLSAPQALSSGLFEAMSCECLVVAGDTGPIREVISHGHNGFLYNQNDGNELAYMVLELLQQRALMRDRGKAARKTIVQKYNVHKQSPKTVSAILKNYTAWKEAQLLS